MPLNFSAFEKTSRRKESNLNFSAFGEEELEEPEIRALPLTITPFNTLQQTETQTTTPRFTRDISRRPFFGAEEIPPEKQKPSAPLSALAGRVVEFPFKTVLSATKSVSDALTIFVLQRFNPLTTNDLRAIELAGDKTQILQRLGFEEGKLKGGVLETVEKPFVGEGSITEDIFTVVETIFDIWITGDLIRLAGGEIFLREFAKQNLKRDILFDIQAKQIPAREVLNFLRGTGEVSPEANSILKNLTTQQRKQLGAASLRIEKLVEKGFVDTGVFVETKKPTTIGKFLGAEGAEEPSAVSALLSERAGFEPVQPFQPRARFKVPGLRTEEVGGELRRIKDFDRSKILKPEEYEVFNKVYLEAQEVLDISSELIESLPKKVTGKEALSFINNVAPLGEQADFIERVVEGLKDIGFEDVTRIEKDVKRFEVTEKGLGALEEFDILAKEAKKFKTAEEFISSRFEKETDTNKVIKDRIDITKLEKLKGGSVRDVFRIGSDKVIKVAKSPKGLEQNSLASDFFIAKNEHFPKVFEVGKDYVVAEFVPRNDKVTREFLKPLKKFSQIDFDNKVSELQDAMVELGLDDFMNYELLWNDFIAVRNWGVRKDGTVVLIDEGALSKSITFTSEVNEFLKQDWREVLQLRKQAKPEISESELTDFFKEVKGKVERPPTIITPATKRAGEFLDVIDQIVKGRIKMRLPSSDVITDWKESLGKANFAKIFRSDRSLPTPDEIADSLDISEDELKNQIAERITVKRPIVRTPEEEFEAKAVEEVQPTLGIEETKKVPDLIASEDLEKLFEKTINEEIKPTAPPVKPPKPPVKPPARPSGAPLFEPTPLGKISFQDIQADISGRLRKELAKDIKAMGGFDNPEFLKNLNEIAGYKFESIEQVKSLFSEKVVSVINKTRRGKEDIAVSKLIRLVERDQLVSLTKAQNSSIKELQRLGKRSDITKFFKEEENQSWVKKIKELQQEKALSNVTVSRIKVALNIDNIKRADQAQLAELVDFMSDLEKGDAFLSIKQQEGLREILSDIERIDLVPKRVVIDIFGDKEEVLGKGIVGRVINELAPTVDIKEGHPLVARIVNEADRLMEESVSEVQRRSEKLDKLLTAAEEVRNKKLSFADRVKRKLVPQNKEIFQAMSGMEVDLTSEEKAVVTYLKNFFKFVKEDLQLEKFRKNYITHLAQPLSEKIVEVGLLQAVKEVFVTNKGLNIPVNIMLELDNIIGSEKFFRFALERTGGLTPTTNIRKIVHTYSQLYETKKALDEILPEGQAVTQLLLQNRTAQWMKKFLQNLKGRGLDSNFRTGKMAWLARTGDLIIDIGYAKLLGLNWWSGLKNLVAGEANSFIVQDFRKFLLGKKRLLENPKRVLDLMKQTNIMEGAFYEYISKGILLGNKKIRDSLLIFQKMGEFEIRGSLLVGELTEKEWATGVISSERIREIKDLIAISQGIFTKADSPLWVQTWFGRLALQMNRWRITNAFLVRRTAVNALKDFKAGNKNTKNTRQFLKMLFMYGTGMYLSYELGKAGYKRMSRVAKSMGEVINSTIELVTTPVISDMVRNNPSISFFGELFFTIQSLASYIVPGIEEPRKLEFRHGIGGTFIAPIERPKELFEGGKDFLPSIDIPEINIEIPEIEIPTISL